MPCRDLAARHELDEPLHVELIQTLAAADRQAEALAAYDRIRSALADQLGVDPASGSARYTSRYSAGRSRPAAERVVVQQTPSAPPDFIGRADELDDDLYGARPARRALLASRF